MKSALTASLIFTLLTLCLASGGSVFAQSPAATPPAEAATSAARPRPPLPMEIAASYADRVEIIRDIPCADGKNNYQKADLYLPKKRNIDKPLPVIALIHGSGWGGDAAVLHESRLRLRFDGRLRRGLR